MTPTTPATNSGGLSTRSDDRSERLAYVALALIPGFGARRLAGLLSAYGSATAACQAPASSRPRSRGTTSPVHHPPMRDAIQLLDRCEALKIRVLTPDDADFPPQLRSIPDPPVMLFARGRLDLLARPAVAIVGSRDHTRYGRDVAKMLGEGAAGGGIVVVSGMARGLDAVAQYAALDGGGTTIGVLGNGIGVVYPAANQDLYHRVESEGLLLTENPPGERPTVGSFPRRNRLISGLAQVVVVVEAARGSGTLVTVASALEQGRDVMAVPGPITSPTSEGTNQLLRDGADPILQLNDLLAKFCLVAKTPAAALDPGQPPLCNLSGTEAQAFNAVTAEARYIDEIAERTGLPIGTLLGVLCGLELGGLVEQLPGSLFRRVIRNS
ncbi:MAG: DNA-processing protein DprA [Gemmatimonadales bacterium]